LLLNPGAAPVDGEGFINGTITTDGALGVIGASDILSWNLYGLGYGASFFSLDNANSFVEVGNNTPVFNPNAGTPDLTATAENLFFNFSGTDGGYLGFLSPSGLGFFGFSAQNQMYRFPNDFLPEPGETAAPFDSDPLLDIESGNQIIATAPAVSAVPDLADTLPLLGFGMGALTILGRRLRQCVR
jgi:hypothetical protein